MPFSKEDIAAELLRRGVDPARVRQAGFDNIARQGETGLIAPKYSTGDKIGDRQITVKDYGSIREARERLGRFYPDIANLDRFHELNVGQRTGGIQHQELGGWNPINAINEVVHPRLRQMEGITSNLQGKARPVGSGATSDFEQRLYRMGVPRKENDGPTNDSIINYMKSVYAEEDDRLSFQENFIRRNGTLAGSQEAWTRYLRSNPYIVTNRNGYSVPNTRRTGWRDYFGVRRSHAPARGKAGPRVVAPKKAQASNDPLGLR